ncbi:MAG: type II toxin-antitoxin system HicB family antitoxin [Clostridiales bacterium]|nr:type II toxin-antitoxin system HicB family antitoxin [Clostridiales bacterium]MDY4180977.1 type II toxin-antitoxin system HicB family antitoxin [Pseudoflavonifractor sp.]
MKDTYPILIVPASEGGYIVRVPALDIETQGETVTECMEMARDAIGLWGITQEDLGNPIPKGSSKPAKHALDEIATLVDVDFSAYRRAHDMRTIRKNVTIPSYLNDLAEQAGVNFSQILQEGLKRRLGI